jgi:hypothetical protein
MTKRAASAAPPPRSGVASIRRFNPKVRNPQTRTRRNANATPPRDRPGDRGLDSVKALALQWFAQMEAGQIDRTQLASRYSAQLSENAVQAMSHQLKQYGASPTSAQVLRSRALDDQTFYLVKLIFPRGDSAAMLVGFDTQGKITGIDFVSMAGD